MQGAKELSFQVSVAVTSLSLYQHCSSVISLRHTCWVEETQWGRAVGGSNVVQYKWPAELAMTFVYIVQTNLELNTLVWGSLTLTQ